MIYGWLHPTSHFTSEATTFAHLDATTVRVRKSPFKGLVSAFRVEVKTSIYTVGKICKK